MNYFDTLDWLTFSYKQSRENMLFSKTRKKLIKGFSQSCVCTIFTLINNLHMQNKLMLQKCCLQRYKLN